MCAAGARNKTVESHFSFATPAWAQLFHVFFIFKLTGKRDDLTTELASVFLKHLAGGALHM